MEGRSSISDPNTTAALREMSQTIAALKQSNDQGSGAYRQHTNSNTWIFSAIAAAGRYRHDRAGNVPDRPLNLVEELARASASLRKRWRQEKMP